MPETTWPEGLIARYLTVGGATVDLTARPDVDADAMQAECHGCEVIVEHNGWYNRDRNTSDARTWAQVHAEKCRAIPRPGA